MPADRLTAETARVGMLVAHPSWKHDVGSVKVINGKTGELFVFASSALNGWWRPSELIPADTERAPSWATEELRKALIAWHSIGLTCGPPRSGKLRRLWNAIEASGLLSPTPPSTTAREATLAEGWWQ